MPYSSFALVTAEIEQDVTIGEHDTVAAVDIFGIIPGGELAYRETDSIPWSNFLRAHQLGLYRGDPGRLVVYGFGVAGGPGSDGLWEAVQYLFENVDSVGAAVTRAATDVGAVAGVWFSVSKGRRKLITRQWRKRGYSAPKLVRFLAKNAQWDPVQLQRMLTVTELEARVMLSNAGYEPSADGLWRLATTPAGQAANAGLHEVAWVAGSTYRPLVPGRSFPEDEEADEPTP